MVVKCGDRRKLAERNPVAIRPDHRVDFLQDAELLTASGAEVLIVMYPARRRGLDGSNRAQTPGFTAPTRASITFASSMFTTAYALEPFLPTDVAWSVFLGKKTCESTGELQGHDQLIEDLLRHRFQ